MPVTGVVAKVTEFGDPPSVSNGQVVSQTWLANITATVNGTGFAQVARAYRILAANAGLYTSVGAIGGWTVNAGNFVAFAAGVGDVMLFPLELPYATGGSGTGATLTGANVRVKPGGGTSMTAKIWSLDHQSVAGVVAFNPLSSVISSSGTGEQILAVPMTSPMVVDATQVFMLQIVSGQLNDAVYSAEVQYTIAGY